MTVPAKILELVELFDSNLEAYKQGRYSKTQIMREFIDPFFEELGWDIAKKSLRNQGQISMKKISL